MPDLAAQIRERVSAARKNAQRRAIDADEEQDGRLAELADNAEQLADALLAAIELHADDETDMCVAEQVGYTVMRWHTVDDDPTLLAVAEKLGIEVDGAA